MLKDGEILDQIEAYLGGHMSLNGFAAWVYETTWDMASETGPRAQAFAYAVLGKVAEHSTAGGPETALRAELEKIARGRREDLDRLARVIVRRAEPDPVQTESGALVLEELFPVAP
jgi:hypothetical protein